MNDAGFIIKDAGLDGQSLRYLTVGDGEETVVILQGWATDFSVYSLVISELAKKYRVVFPLLPGFGGD